MTWLTRGVYITSDLVSDRGRQRSARVNAGRRGSLSNRSRIRVRLRGMRRTRNGYTCYRQHIPVRSMRQETSLQPSVFLLGINKVAHRLAALPRTPPHLGYERSRLDTDGRAPEQLLLGVHRAILPYSYPSHARESRHVRQVGCRIKQNTRWTFICQLRETPSVRGRMANENSRAPAPIYLRTRPFR